MRRQSVLNAGTSAMPDWFNDGGESSDHVASNAPNPTLTLFSLKQNRSLWAQQPAGTAVQSAAAANDDDAAISDDGPAVSAAAISGATGAQLVCNACPCPRAYEIILTEGTLPAITAGQLCTACSARTTDARYHTSNLPRLFPRSACLLPRLHVRAQWS